MLNIMLRPLLLLVLLMLLLLLLLPFSVTRVINKVTTAINSYSPN